MKTGLSATYSNMVSTELHMKMTIGGRSSHSLRKNTRFVEKCTKCKEQQRVISNETINVSFVAENRSKVATVQLLTTILDLQQLGFSSEYPP